MSSIQFIYSGSDTRKITRLNNDPVIISGDSNSTTFSFKFPESHKGYKKTIQWDFWIKDSEGNLINPSYPLIDDEHKVPEDVTYYNSGRQVGFSIVFEKDDDTPFQERSELYPIYVSKGIRGTKTEPPTSTSSTPKEEGYYDPLYYDVAPIIPIQFIYAGSDTRKITRLGRDPVIISGDSNSTIFKFKFPESHKGYKKTIEWDFWMKDLEGNPMNPSYPLVNDEHIIPGDVTYFNSGKQVGFSLIFERDDDPLFQERSTIYPIHVSKGVKRTKTVPSTGILNTLMEEAYITSSYDVNTGEDRPEITFSSYNGTVYTLLLDMPYLNTLGKIPRRFLEEDYLQDLYFVDDDSELSSLDVQSGDFALNTTSKDLFILTSDDPDTGWYKIHSPNPNYDTITVENDALLKSNLEVRGNEIIKGSTLTEGDIHTDSDLSVGGDISVDGNADIVKNANVEGTLDVTGDVSMASDTTVGGDLVVIGNAVIDGSLDTFGDVKLRSDALIEGDVVVGDGITDSNVQIKGNLDTTGDFVTGGKHTSTSSEVYDDLQVGGNAIVDGDVTVGDGITDSNVLVEGTLDITGGATVGGKLIAKSSEVTEGLLVKGDSTVMGDLSTDGSLSAGAGISGASIDIIRDSSVGGSSTVTGSSSIGGTLDVTDVASFKSDASVKGNVAIGDDVNESNVSVKGTLDVTKNATVGGKLTTGAIEVIGDSLTKGNTAVDFDANVGGELAVGSDISGESISARGDLDVTGKTNITGDTTLGGNLDVTGGIYTDSDLHVIGTAEVGGATMLRSTLDTDGKVTVGNDIQRADLEVKGNAKIGNDLTVDGGINTILNPDSVVIADSTGKLNTTTVSKTELETLDGVTSSVQTQINTKEASANKVSSWSATTNNVRYPSEKLTKDTLDKKVEISQGLTEASKFVLTDNAGDIKVFRTLAVTDIPSLPASKITSGAFADARIPTNIERNTNKVTAFGTTPSDVKYPSEKLVKDNLDLKADDNAVIHKAGNESITGIKTFENNVNIGTMATPRDVSIKGNITIEGNIVQNGSAYETHAETIHTTDDKIILRAGAVGGLVAGDTSGFTAKLYDGVNDGVLALDNSGTIRVGDVGATQPVLTRKESADMSNAGLIAWDAPNQRAHTRILTANDIPSLNASKINAGTFADARIPTNIERNTNKVTSFQSVPTDTAYPSEKLVKDALDLKAEGNVVSSHTSDKNNPHAVTKKQLGLEFADNTSDTDKPVSTATQTALDTKAPTDHKSTGTLHGVGDATHYGHVKVDSALSTTSVNTVQNKVITSALGTKQDNLTFDTTPTSASLNPVTSGGVFTALGLKANTSYVNTELGKKQNTLSWDSTPIINSTKPVTSGGIYTALGLKQDNLTFDTAPKASSTNPVTSEGIKDAIDIKANTAYVNTELGKKQNNLTFDTAPVADSINPATSGGIYSALATKVDSNNNITAGTKTKITYDAKGLVTGGANLIESDIPSLSASKITSGTFADARIPAMAISKITGLQTALDTKALNTDLTSHATSKANPHSVTKAQVGLGHIGESSITLENNDAWGLHSRIHSTAGSYASESLWRFSNERCYDVDGKVIGSHEVRCLNGVSSRFLEVNQFALDDAYVKSYLNIYVNQDGDRWVTHPMRPAPGSTDSVNAKYVLDRVDEMVNYVDDEVTAHTGRTDNPHAVTKSQVGLGAYPASPADIGISTATQTALNTKAPTSHATSATTYGVGSTTNYGHVKVDSALSGTSVNPVQNKVVKAELDTKALNTDLTAHTTSKTNPHGVTKAQVGLGAYPASPADIGISTATQTALDGTVKNTGNEDIAGIKNFLDNIEIGKGGGMNGNHGYVYCHNTAIGLTYEEILDGKTGILGGITGRPSGSRNTHFLDFRVESAHSSVWQGVRRPSTTNQEKGAYCGLSVNSNGDGWYTIPMRPSPGSSDAVNTKYVLDRVDEMVGYVDDAVSPKANTSYVNMRTNNLYVSSITVTGYTTLTWYKNDTLHPMMIMFTNASTFGYIRLRNESGTEISGGKVLEGAVQGQGSGWNSYTAICPPGWSFYFGGDGTKRYFTCLLRI